MTITAKQRMPTPRAWCSDFVYTGSTPRFVWSTYESHILRADASYATARNGSSPAQNTVFQNNSGAMVENYFATGQYLLTQYFLEFDVSAVPTDRPVHLRMPSYGDPGGGWIVEVREAPAFTSPITTDDWVQNPASQPLLGTFIARTHTATGDSLTVDSKTGSLTAAILAAKSAGQPLRLLVLAKSLTDNDSASVTHKMQFYTRYDTEAGGIRRPRLTWYSDVVTEIYVIGDHNVLYLSAPSNEVYSPANNTWRMAMGVGQGWEGNGGFKIGDYIYMVSGTRVYRYDIVDDSWTYHLAQVSGGADPTKWWAGQAGDAVTYGGKAYMFNSYGVWVYDPADNSFRSEYGNPPNTGPEGGTVEFQGAGVVLDGDYVYTAGRTNSGFGQKISMRYHIPSKTWDQLPRIPVIMDDATCAILDRRLVVFGYAAGIYSYPIDEGLTGEWRYEGDKPQYGQLQAACTYGDGIYVFGGEDGGEQVWGDQYGKMFCNWFFTFGLPVVPGEIAGGGGGPSLRRPNTANPPSSQQKSVRVLGRNTYH